MTDSYEYIVQEGDNLSTILYNATGSSSVEAYQRLATENNISDPNQIMVGQKIKIDSSYFNNGSNTSSGSNMTSNSSSASKFASESTNNNMNSSSLNETNNSKESVISVNSAEISNGSKESASIFETDDQSELEKILSSDQSKNTRNDRKSTNDNVSELAKQKIENTNANKTTPISSSVQSSTSNNSSTGGQYIPSDYEICYPGNVFGWEPRNSFKTFIVKENAGEEFVAVNNCVKNCCTDIDGVIKSLQTLRTKMGENTGTTSQIDNIVKSLGEKKQDLITKNQELINACEQVVQYVYENKTSKSKEASAVAQTIEQIDIYKG